MNARSVYLDAFKGVARIELQMNVHDNTTYTFLKGIFNRFLKLSLVILVNTNKD